MTFSVWYVSHATGELCPMHTGIPRAHLKEAVDTFRVHAHSGWAAASRWVLKRDRKTIARVEVRRRG